MQKEVNSYTHVGMLPETRYLYRYDPIMIAITENGLKWVLLQNPCLWFYSLRYTVTELLLQKSVSSLHSTYMWFIEYSNMVLINTGFYCDVDEKVHTWCIVRMAHIQTNCLILRCNMVLHVYWKLIGFK